MILEFHNISFVWHDCCHTFVAKITKVFIFNFLILKNWQFFPKNLAKLVEFTLKKGKIPKNPFFGLRKKIVPKNIYIAHYIGN
jgi:hypothetical protein